MFRTFDPDDMYAQVLSNAPQTSVTNGLNQLSTVNGTAAAYDARGNMTTDPVTGKTYTYYGANNQLWTNPSPYTVFAYDALDRLQSFNTGAPVTNYVSDGSAIVAEYDGSNVLQKRYAFGAGGQPLVAYDAAGNRTWMLSDERGSVVALANDSAAMTAINTYDEYGIPSATNAGTFQYAGMLWLPRPGLYAPTFRVYGAHLGRFGQTDPIGYAGGVNLYNYTGNDPVNLVDPLGLATLENGPDLGISLNCLDLCGFQQGTSGQDILVTGPRCHGTWLDHMCFDSFDPIDFSPFFEPFRRGETGRAEAGAGDADRNRQCPSHPILGALGKANGAINTLIGGAAAAGSALAGALGGNSPQANFGNNSIQVTNAWTFGGRAYTIGNVQVYSAGNGPGVGSTSYTGAFVNNGSHEEGHTIQSQILGPLYLPSVLLGSALGNNNPMEVGADKYALGQSCTGF
jgi:RHS repeat-associated protein